MSRKLSWPTQKTEVARLLDNGEIKVVLMVVIRCTEKERDSIGQQDCLALRLSQQWPQLVFTAL